MTKESHLLIGATTGVIFCNWEPFMIGGILAGSMAPDVIERIVALNDQRTFWKIHRKFTHWWGVWAGILLLLLFKTPIPILQINTFMSFFVIGALIHIACDSLTKTGVPFLNPFKPGYGLKLIKTRSKEEYIIVASYLIFAGVIVLLPLYWK